MSDVWFQTDTEQAHSFDLSAAKKITNIGKIDLRNSLSDSVKLSLDDVLAASQPDILYGKTRLKITGDSGDSIYLGADSTTWSAAGSIHDGAESYMIYVNSSAQLLINDKMQTIVF